MALLQSNKFFYKNSVATKWCAHPLPFWLFTRNCTFRKLFGRWKGSALHFSWKEQHKKKFCITTYWPPLLTGAQSKRFFGMGQIFLAGKKRLNNKVMVDILQILLNLKTGRLVCVNTRKRLASMRVVQLHTQPWRCGSCGCWIVLLLAAILLWPTRFSANTIQKEPKKKTIQKEVKTSFWILKPNIIARYCILLSRYLNSDNYEQH